MGTFNSKVESRDELGYTGETDQRGRKHGQGTFQYPSGSSYEGAWLNDKKHGQGKFVSASGNVYEGLWEADMRAGAGRLTSAQGALIYEGNWEADKMHGNMDEGMH